ncbi:MAG: M23 family metallopeptidase [Chloroflexi bacterium]|nr:M23 family metallopeptidase [Chloroflexota bacterium]
MATPYDTTIAGVFWTGKSVGEKSIGELVNTIKTYAPNMTALFVKTSDGAKWQAAFDSVNPALTVSGPASLAGWVNTAGAAGIQIHAWCVLNGADLMGEAQRVIEACKVSGIKSMLLDVEDGAGYFSGGAAAARQLIQTIRASIPADFHLALNFDARGQHPKHIYIEEWLPYVQSLHPMVYHTLFGVVPRSALDNAFAATSAYGKPVAPMLQAFDGTPPNEMADAGNYAFQKGAVGISYFRLGTIGPQEFAAIRSVQRPQTVTATEGGGTTASADPDPTKDGAVIVRPGQPGYDEGQYQELPPDQAWQEFVDIHGWTVRYKPTSPLNMVYAGYHPPITAPGRYAIEVFIPSARADTEAAEYYITYYQNGRRLERKVSLDQSIYFDQWASLGQFELDPSAMGADSGRVNLVDYTLEDPPHWIAFSAIRWRPVPRPLPVPEGVADGFDAPVGNDAERRSPRLWPGLWKDAWYPNSGYAQQYHDSTGALAYHTGADLNLNEPIFNLDRGSPVYAVASGRVAFAERVGDYWRNIIVIEHDPTPDGTKVCARYAHVEGIIVSVGQRVTRGQQISVVGSSGGSNGNYHLHFDLSPTNILLGNAGQWPGTKLADLRANYIDPIEFIRNHRPQ